jgi:hypothetical protein
MKLRVIMRKFLVILGLAFCLFANSATAQPVAVESDATIYTPDTSVRYAVGDLNTLPTEHQPYIRYLSLYNIPKGQRRDVAQVVSFTINSLSKRKSMYIPVFVGASNETLIRLNLKDYDIDPKEWDRLGREGSGAKPYPEPYFHAFVQTVDNAVTERTVKKTRQVPYTYIDQYGRRIQGTRTETYDAIEKVPGVSSKKLELSPRVPWLDQTSIEFLMRGTHSEFPIFRADWFIVYSTVEPAYHRLLGLGDNEKDFERVVFADESLAEKARGQHKAVVVKSSVTRNNRTMTRSPTFTGGYFWKTKDSLRSVDERNYVQNLLDEQFDASEIIATLPNGLQAYLVTDAKGKRLDKADNEIATDYMAADKIVRNGRSCIYCHAPGINPIQDEIRTLNKKLQNQEQVMLLVASEKDAYRIQDLFSSNLDRQITRDQQIYADAIGEATGSTPADIAGKYFRQWEGYEEYLLTKEVIARDCGLSLTELERYARTSNDPLLLGLINNPIRPVRRDQFERSFQDFMVLMARLRVTPPLPGNQPTIIIDPSRLNGKTVPTK